MRGRLLAATVAACLVIASLAVPPAQARPADAAFGSGAPAPARHVEPAGQRSGGRPAAAPQHLGAPQGPKNAARQRAGNGDPIPVPASAPARPALAAGTVTAFYGNVQGRWPGAILYGGDGFSAYSPDATHASASLYMAGVNLVIVAPSGETLTQSTYSGATYDGSGGTARITVGSFRSCDQSLDAPGTFTVHSIGWGADSIVSTLAVDFAVPCADGRTFFGDVRYNSSLPLKALSIVWPEDTYAPVQFGTEAIGLRTSGPNPIQFQNVGNAPIQLGTLDFTGDFGVYPGIPDADTCSGAVLQPGATCLAFLEFAPTYLGTREGGVSLPADVIGGSVGDIQLRGTGKLGVVITYEGTGSGGASCDPDCQPYDSTPGAEVTLTAQASAGSYFVGWGGDCASATGTTCVLDKATGHVVTLTFDLVVTPPGHLASTGGFPGTTDAPYKCSARPCIEPPNSTVAVSASYIVQATDVEIRVSNRSGTLLYNVDPATFFESPPERSMVGRRPVPLGSDGLPLARHAVCDDVHHRLPRTLRVGYVQSARCLAHLHLDVRREGPVLAVSRPLGRQAGRRVRRHTARIVFVRSL